MEGKFYNIGSGIRGFVPGEGYINFPTEDEYFEYLREVKENEDRRVSGVSD